VGARNQVLERETVKVNINRSETKKRGEEKSGGGVPERIKRRSPCCLRWEKEKEERNKRSRNRQKGEHKNGQANTRKKRCRIRRNTYPEVKEDRKRREDKLNKENSGADEENQIKIPESLEASTAEETKFGGRGQNVPHWRRGQSLLKLTKNRIKKVFNVQEEVPSTKMDRTAGH